MTVDVFRCPDCGATLRALSGVLPAACEFCHAILKFPDGVPSAPAGADDIVVLLRAGKKIEAIKVYRQKTKQGLREAKDAVDAIEKTLRDPRPVR